MRRLRLPRHTMRPFYLLRSEAVSGTTRTRVVAMGIVFPSGRVVLEWNQRRPRLTACASLAQVRHLHGHGGRTRICMGIPDSGSVWRQQADGRTNRQWWQAMWQRWADPHPEGLSLLTNGWGPWPGATMDCSPRASKTLAAEVHDVDAESARG